MGATVRDGIDEIVADVFDGPQVALPQMLDAREHRAVEQARLLGSAEGGECLLALTLAIPGPVKTSVALVGAFDELLDEAVEVLDDAQITRSVRYGGATGPECLMLVTMDARELKRRMVAIEQTHPLGRLADLDVLERTDTGLRSVSRTELGFAPRTCLVCGGEAKVCARSRAHSVAEMQRKIATIIEEGGTKDRG